MSSLTGITAIDNTITGLEDLYLDELDVTNVVADTIASTSVASTTISLNGTDLQTTLTDLQSQITAGGGYFVLTCEFAGNPVNSGRFGFGAGLNSGVLRTTMPNCSMIACRFELSSSLTTNNQTNIVVEKNGTATAGGSGNYLTGVTLIYKSVANGDFSAVSYVEGDYFTVRFNNAGGNTFTGSAVGARASFVFQTNAVDGTNGTNGTDGTNGQNVSFNTPTIATITPATTASISDTIVTASGTQTHSLNFNIPRGKNSSFQVGTISSVGTASPSLSITGATDANGDNVYTMNFGLQQGIQGNQGSKGDKGDTGDEAASTLLAIASAGAAAASAGLASGYASSAAISAGLAASNGASAGAEAGAEAAEGVLSGLETRVTTLEGEMDTQQTKTQYISQSATETTIGGGKTIVNSTNYYGNNVIFDVEATNITLSSDLDFSEITIGSILNLNTSATINTRAINIGTNGIGMTAPTLNIGTYNRTATEIRGESIEILASQTTTINGSSNLVLDATTIDIGHSTGDVNISGSTIDIGTTGVLNTINIGNDYSIVNINTGISQYINVDNFVNQLGF